MAKQIGKLENAFGTHKVKKIFLNLFRNCSAMRLVLTFGGNPKETDYVLF